MLFALEVYLAICESETVNYWTVVLNASQRCIVAIAGQRRGKGNGLQPAN